MNFLSEQVCQTRYILTRDAIGQNLSNRTKSSILVLFATFTANEMVTTYAKLRAARGPLK